MACYHVCRNCVMLNVVCLRHVTASAPERDRKNGTSIGGRWFEEVCTGDCMAWSIRSYECISSVREATGVDARACWGVL